MNSPSTVPALIPVSYRALVHNLVEAIAGHLDLETHSVRIGLLEITAA